MPTGTVTFKLTVTPMPGGAFQVIGTVTGMGDPMERGILARDEQTAHEAALHLLLIWADMFTHPDAPQSQTTH